MHQNAERSHGAGGGVNPPPGAVKSFLTAEIEQKKGDARWLNKATELVRLKVKDKNDRAAKSRDHKLVNGGSHAHLSQMR